MPFCRCWESPIRSQALEYVAGICGVDEAGRGPLAGAVYAAAVMLDPQRPISGLNDSKKLSEKKRDVLTEIIKREAVHWAIASATVEEIDRLNILQATFLAMQRAVSALGGVPQEVWIDGNRAPLMPVPVQTVIKGDGKIAAIAAASILAKTARDTEMQKMHEMFPQYGFDRHKGYPTAQHIAALAQFGVSSIHRTSYAPVQKILRQRGLEL